MLCMWIYDAGRVTWPTLKKTPSVSLKAWENSFVLLCHRKKFTLCTSLYSSQVQQLYLGTDLNAACGSQNPDCFFPPFNFAIFPWSSFDLSHTYTLAVKQALHISVVNKRQCTKWKMWTVSDCMVSSPDVCTQTLLTLFGCRTFWEKSKATCTSRDVFGEPLYWGL